MQRSSLLRMAEAVPAWWLESAEKIYCARPDLTLSVAGEKDERAS